VAALASSAMLASFLQTIMTPLVPELPVTFGASASSVSWVLTAALLAACATAPISGRIGDIVGKKKVLLGLLGIIVIGSVLGALSTSLEGVIAARALQGVGLGVMALNVSALREAVPPARLPAAVAAVSASNGIGGALGLPLSAVVSEFFDWHGLFWLAAVLAVLSALAIGAFVPNSAPVAATRFDLVGGIGLAAGLCGVVLAISQGPVWGWASAATIVCGAGGLAVLGLWTRHELRTPVPLIDLRLMARRPVLVTNLIGITSGFCWFAIPGLVARLLQSSDGSGPGFGLDMVTASIVIVPTGLSMLVVAPLAQRLVRRLGTRVAIRLGTITTGIAYLYALATGHEPWQLAVVACLVGVGSVLVFSSASLVIMANVPTTATGAANGVNAVFRWLGSTMSSAILGAILASVATTYLSVPVPTLDGYRLSFAIAAGSGLVGFVLATFLPKRAAA
jgi:MFS family permease